MPTPREIDAEAEALYEDYRNAKPAAEDGFPLPAWPQVKPSVQGAWRAAAVGSLARRKTIGGPSDPDVSGPQNPDSPA